MHKIHQLETNIEAINAEKKSEPLIRAMVHLKKMASVLDLPAPKNPKPEKDLSIVKLFEDAEDLIHKNQPDHNRLAACSAVAVYNALVEYEAEADVQEMHKRSHKRKS